MANYTRNTLTGSLAPVNNELEKIQQAIIDKLDRSPAVAQSNAMLNNLDMNSNRIINYPNAVGDSDLVTKGQVSSLAPVQSVNGLVGNVVILSREANTLDATTTLISGELSESIDTIVRTRGFANAGDGGGAEWMQNGVTGQTPSQTPLQLSGILLNDVKGNQWALITNGVINPAKLGATNGTTSASNATAYFAILSAYCAATGDTWTASGDYWVESVDVYTSFVGDANFYSSNNGQTAPVVNILPLPADLGTGTLSDIQSALPLSKGQSTIASLGAYAGKKVRIATSEVYLKRLGSATSYRYDTTFTVLNAAGEISPPIPHDFPNTLTMSVFDTEVLKDTVSVNNLSVTINSGAVIRDVLVTSARSNTNIGITAENLTATSILQMFKTSFCANNIFTNCLAVGAKVVATNYGYNISGANHSFISCYERDCRRGWDATYCNGASIIGGNYPDGIGAHLGFNTVIDDVTHIGFSSQNPNPLHFSGGDVSCTNSTIVGNTAGQSIFGVRTDAPEVIGLINLSDNKIIFDLDAYTGSGDFSVYKQSMPSTSYDGLRDLFLPKLVTVKNNHIEVNGAAHTARIIPVNLFGGNSTTAVYLADTTIDFSGNIYSFANGAPSLQLNANKSNLLEGSLLTINFNDACPLSTYFGNANNLLTAPFLDFNAPNIVPVLIRADYGWLRNSLVKNANYTAATGTPAYQPTARWKSLTNANTAILKYSIADDAALQISADDNYSSIEFWRANDVTRSAKYIIDADGTGQVGAVYENGSVANAGNTVLTGTTGTDGNVSLSCDGNLIYIENRAGAGAVLIVALTDASL